MRCRGQIKEYSCSQGKTGAADPDIMKIRIQPTSTQAQILCKLLWWWGKDGKGGGEDGKKYVNTKYTSIPKIHYFQVFLRHEVPVSETFQANPF